MDITQTATRENVSLPRALHLPNSSRSSLGTLRGLVLLGMKARAESGVQNDVATLVNTGVPFFLERLLYSVFHRESSIVS